MSNMTQQEKSQRLADFAGLQEAEGQDVFTGPCWINPTDGVLSDNIYLSMSFAWVMHLEAVKQYPAYRTWWIAHALDSEENPHWDWLDKIYAAITMRPIFVVDGVPTRGKLPNGVNGSQITDSFLRRSGREVMCISTKGIEA